MGRAIVAATIRSTSLPPRPLTDSPSVTRTSTATLNPVAETTARPDASLTSIVSAAAEPLTFTKSLAPGFHLQGVDCGHRPR